MLKLNNLSIGIYSTTYATTSLDRRFIDSLVIRIYSTIICF